MSPPPHAARRQSRLATALRVVGTFALFVGACTGGLVLHLDTTPARRIVARVTEDILEGVLEGDFEVGAIERIELDRIDIASFAATSPAGREVLHVEGLAVTSPWPSQVLALVTSDAGLSLDHVRLEEARVHLGPEGEQLAIAAAFSPRASDEATPPSESPSKPFRLHLGQVELGEVTVQGAVTPAVPLDATIFRLRGMLHLDPDGLAIVVERAAVEERALLGAIAKGTTELDLRVPLAAEGDPRSRLVTSFVGSVGPVNLSAGFRLLGRTMLANVDVPRLGPSDLTPWLPRSPLARPVAARATLTGELPFLDVAAEVRGAPAPGRTPARVHLDGRIAAEDRVRISASVDAQEVDLRLFDAELPASTLAARARVETALRGSTTAVLVHLQSVVGDVAGQAVPRVEGRVRASADGVESWLSVDEPGAPIAAWLRVPPEGGIDFSARGEIAHLDQLPRLRPYLGRDLGGRGRVAAAGRWRDGTLDVAVEASADRLLHRPSKTAVGGAEGAARLSGPPEDLRVEGHLRGADLHAGDRRFPHFSVSAVGPVERPSFRVFVKDDEDREIAAKGVLEPREARATQLRVSVGRAGVALEGKVDEVRAAGGRVDVRGVDLEGLGGSLGGGLRVEGGELRGKLRAKGLDLGELSQLAALPQRVHGEVDVDVDLTPQPAGRDGRVALTVRDASFLTLEGVSFQATATFEGDRVSPLLSLNLRNPEAPEGESLPCAGEWATVVVGGDFALGGPLLEATSWTAAEGRGSLSLDRIRLPCVRETLERLRLVKVPVAELEGLLSATATFTLPGEAAWPSIDSYAARSSGLVVEPVGEAGEPILRSDRVDVALRGGLDADHALRVELELVDRDAPTPLPFVTAIIDTGDLKAVVDASDRDQAARSLPLRIDIHSRRQPVSRWAAIPAPYRDALEGLGGEVDVDLFAEGSIDDPSLALRLQTWGVAPVEGGDLAEVLDLDTDTIATFHGDKARFDTDVVRGDRQIASLTGEVDEVTHAERRRGRLEADLKALPLRSVPGIGRMVNGDVTGHVRLEGLGVAPTIDVALDVPVLEIGGMTRFENARVILHEMEGRPGVLSLTGALPLPSERGGLLLTGYAGIRWRDELVPEPDPAKPAGLYVVASQFPLAAATPFARPAVGRLDGTVDGEARLVYQAGEEPDFDVDLLVQDGVIVLPGQELTDVRARIRSAGATIRVEDLTASIDPGRAQGWVIVRRDGFSFSDVTSRIVVAAAEPIPVSLSGVPIGSASGTVILSASREKTDDAEEIDVVVTMADLHVQLPPGANKSLQSLEDHSDITISHPLAPPEAGADTNDKRRITVTVGVAGAEVESNILRLGFSTVPDHSITWRSLTGTVDGQIQIDGGELNLLGKRFEFDRGLVRLRPEEPSNPDVNVTAHWDSPDGITVFVDYIGPLQPINEDKIRFRSSPSRPEEEVISLVLLGEDVAGEDRAAALTRGVAAAQFNEVLGGVMPGLSASFGANDDGYVSTTVSYRFTDRISAAATIEQSDATNDGAATSTGSNSSATNRTTLSLDWRFAPNFLLRGSVGVGQGASSGLDLLFQFRY